MNLISIKPKRKLFDTDFSFIVNALSFVLRAKLQLEERMININPHAAFIYLYAFLMLIVRGGNGSVCCNVEFPRKSITLTTTISPRGS